MSVVMQADTNIFADRFFMFGKPQTGLSPAVNGRTVSEPTPLVAFKKL
jgi:hypothetical protein